MLKGCDLKLILFYKIFLTIIALTGEDDKQRDQLCENLSGTVTPTAKVVQDEDSQKERELAPKVVFLLFFPTFGSYLQIFFLLMVKDC